MGASTIRSREYQIERLTAVQRGRRRLQSASNTATLATFSVVGQRHEPASTSTSTRRRRANRTYQYRIRARGNDTASPGPTGRTLYLFSRGQAGGRHRRPLERRALPRRRRGDGNVDGPGRRVRQLHRAAPGARRRRWFDSLCERRDVGRRQTGFPKSSTTYADRSTIAARTYEYRVAAVQDDAVGEYTEWVARQPR